MSGKSKRCNDMHHAMDADTSSDDFGYLAWHEDAERRTKAGQVQLQCAGCGLWYWPKAKSRAKLKAAQTEGEGP